MTEQSKCPGDLGDAGRALWARLSAVYTFEPAEAAQLEVACRMADDVAGVERVIAAEGYVLAAGRLNPAVAEARQGRLALTKLIGALCLPDEEDKPRSAASRSAQHAANARWARVRAQRERLADGPA